MWLKAIGALLVLLVIWSLKSSYEARVIVSLGAVAGLVYFGLSRKR